MPEIALSDGVSLNYEEWGDSEAPAVVLLHGFTSDLRMWKGHAEAFAREYHVIAPDLRGHGASGSPEAEHAYSLPRFAGDVRELLVALQVDLCALVGCSFGGMVALQFTTMWPELVAALVVSDSSPAWESERYAEPFRDRERGMLEMEDIARRFGMEALGKRMAARVTDPFVAEGAQRRFAGMDRDGYLGSARARRERPDLIPLLRERVTAPVLICTGDVDPVRSAADVMLEELPHARLAVFRETGHGVPSIRPEQFLTTVLGFFHDVEDGRPVAGTRTV
ncbi:MAG: alpha/beta hydrolase [Chloroflexi bacterium]|nr:alpha/beta hydrolase [Chloroflexota bacterium]